MLMRHLIQQVYFLKAFLPNPSGHDIAETLLAPRYIQRVAQTFRINTDDGNISYTIYWRIMYFALISSW